MPHTRQTEFLMQDLGAGVDHLKQLKDSTKPTFSIKGHYEVFCIRKSRVHNVWLIKQEHQSKANKNSHKVTAGDYPSFSSNFCTRSKCCFLQTRTVYLQASHYRNQRSALVRHVFCKHIHPLSEPSRSTADRITHSQTHLGLRDPVNTGFVQSNRNKIFLLQLLQ